MLLKKLPKIGISPSSGTALIVALTRVLRDGGGLGLDWNIRDEREPWVAELGRIIIGQHEVIEKLLICIFGRGHALLMVGWAGAAWHLELVGDPEDVTPAAPTEEDLLVLYLGGEVDEDLVRRLIDAGGTRVSARNPYWDRWGITIADLDGYRLVLSTLSWP